MLSGAHIVLYSTDAEADRAFLTDVIELDGVDAGDGWMIFATPPAEVAVHPAGTSGKHELFFLCDDIEATVARLRDKGVAPTSVSDEGWGLLSRITLPGGGTIGIYQPRHARPEPA